MLGDGGGTGAEDSADQADIAVDGGAVAGQRGGQPGRAVQVGQLGGSDLQDLAADLGLELVGGAMGDDLAVVDDGDVAGQVVGLLHVLGGGIAGPVDE